MADLISSPVDWTPLRTDLRPVQDTVIGQRFEEVKLDGQDFVHVPIEITEIIQLAQAGWGAQLGPGARIGYWAAAKLLIDMLTAHVNAGVPTRG